jgi:hypothetical protein
MVFLSLLGLLNVRQLSFLVMFCMWLGVAEGKEFVRFGLISTASECHPARIHQDEQNYLQKLSLPANSAVLLGSPCFGSDSLGNSLSDYFEGRLCARELGMTYVAAPKMHPANHNDFANHTFFRSLPTMVDPENGNVVRGIRGELEAAVRKTCCLQWCHQWIDSLIHKNMLIAGSIFRKAIDAYWYERQLTGVTELSVANFPNKSGSKFGWRGKIIDIVPDMNLALPIIPDVAIHYRCGDNTVKNYGFLPFSAMKSVINSTDRSIYIMSEHSGRNADDKRKRRCRLILEALVEYLMNHFSNATVVLLRGGDMFDDLARLTFAPKTICSASTFCLWPAVASTSNAYFPTTQLAGYEKGTDYGPHFHWLDDAKFQLFSGLAARRAADEVILRYLQKE